MNGLTAADGNCNWHASFIIATQFLLSLGNSAVVSPKFFLLHRTRLHTSWDSAVELNFRGSSIIILQVFNIELVTNALEERWFDIDIG